LQYPTMALLPPVALVVGAYDLVRLKAFLAKVEQKEVQEA